MDAFAELFELVGRDTVRAHQNRVAVTSVTGTRDVGLVHIGMGVAGGFHVMTTVATDTGRSVLVFFFIEGLSMKAGFVQG